MSSMIYTKNSSGAIRRARRRKPTRGYLAALIKHIKFLRNLGFKVDSKGKMKKRAIKVRKKNGAKKPKMSRTWHGRPRY